MKIVIIHGDDTPKSYQRLDKYISFARKKGWEINRLDKSTENLIENFVSTGLFTKERLFIVKNFLLVSSKVIEWLNTEGLKTEGRLVIYHENLLTAAQLKKFTKLEKVEKFLLPKTIWSLMDSLYPGNTKTVLHLLHQTLQHEPVEFVFALLAKQVRDLWLLKKDPKGTAIPSWKKSRMVSQASRFTEDSLRGFYSELAEIDIKAKTSKADLLQMLDFTLVNSLQ